MKHIDDKKLIEGCIKNDRISQKLLYEKYASAMLGICMRYANCKDEAEDIMIEGFINVFTHINTYKEECSLAFWIKKVIVNKAISYYRENVKHYYHLSIDEYEDIADDTIYIDNSLSEKEILNMIQNIPESLRIVLNMKIFEALKYDEIAEKLNISETACRTRFVRAKKWLEERIS